MAGCDGRGEAHALGDGSGRVELVGDASVPLVGTQTDDPEAYNLYLLGRHFWNKRTKGAIKAAISHFDQALARDPDFAWALVGLADAYCIAGFYDYLPPRESFPKARVAAEKALELDSSLAQAHNSLGYIALYFDWDWADAEREFTTAIDLNPQYPVAHQWYANLLTAVGRFDQATEEMIHGSRLDPLSLINAAAVGWVHYYAGDGAKAFSAFDRCLELEPTFYLAYLWRGWTHERMGSLDDATTAIEQAVELSNRSANTVASLAHVHASAGRRESALQLLRELEARGQYVPPYELAKVHLALGNDDRAFDLLESAAEDRSHSLVFLKVDPQLRPHRSHPRFKRLVARVGL